MKLSWNQHIIVILAILIALPQNITSQSLENCGHCEIELLSCEEQCASDIRVILTCTRNCLAEQQNCLKECNNIY